MSWTVTRADGSDLDEIMALERATFPADAWSRDLMAAELSSPHGYYLVARDPVEGDLVGYAGLLAPSGAGHADVQTLAVAARARRRGLGRILVLALIEEARRRDASEVFLEVRSDNAGAQALYASQGFEPIGVRPRYYQPEGVDAVVMRLVVPAAPEVA